MSMAGHVLRVLQIGQEIVDAWRGRITSESLTGVVSDGFLYKCRTIQRFRRAELAPLLLRLRSMPQPSKLGSTKPAPVAAFVEHASRPGLCIHPRSTTLPTSSTAAMRSPFQR